MLASFTRLVDVKLKYLYAGKVRHKIGFISAITSSKRSIQSQTFGKSMIVATNSAKNGP